MAPRRAQNPKKTPSKGKAPKKAVRAVSPCALKKTLRSDLLLSLPAELMFEIFKLLIKSDLKSLRSVCKTLAGVITSLLFDNIFLSGSATDLDHASFTTQNFGKFIKTIYISPLTFERLQMPKYRDEVRASMSLANTPPKRGIKWQEHINKGYEVYRNLRESHENILSSGEIAVLLSHALVSAPTVRRVILTTASRDRDVSDTEAQNVCPYIAKCKLPRASHSHFYINPTKLWHWSPGSVMFHSILLAMSTASNPVREFAIEYEPFEYGLSLYVQSFNMMPRQAQRAAAVFSNLTKLRLTLIHDDNFLSKDEGVFKNMQIAKILSTASNLEILFIEAGFRDVFDAFGVTSFEAVFHGCQFRKLKTLYLFALDARVQEMLGFLGRIERLEHFAISCCNLKSGLWSDLAEWTRAYGHLKYASMSQLYGGFGDVDVIEWRDCYADYENFSFHSGPNPFSAHELLRYQKDEESQRESLKSPSGTLDYYQRWF